MFICQQGSADGRGIVFCCGKSNRFTAYTREAATRRSDNPGGSFPYLPIRELLNPLFTIRVYIAD
ncbi:MAG: hypothetical protein EA360_09045 [Balneolaceae bacterium]|nr:MAG: hypothetical protein EA360_09045 [Balneolaceae bacterium]